MEIQIDHHTLARAEERGTDRQEIIDVLKTGFSVPAKALRRGNAKVYEFRRQRNGRFYEQKRVEVYYIEEDNQLVTVTVYVFYGKWKD